MRELALYKNYIIIIYYYYPGSCGGTFKPLTPAWGNNESAFSTRQGGLTPDLGRNADWLGSQANYEIKIKITIYFYKIMISYEKYSTFNLY